MIDIIFLAYFWYHLKKINTLSSKLNKIGSPIMFLKASGVQKWQIVKFSNKILSSVH